MVFSSLIFLWLFLPITLIGYYIMPRRAKNLFLLVVSLFFYAWGEPVYIRLMVVSILVNWAAGLLMECCSKGKKLVLALDILFNLGLLGYYKYFNFLMDILRGISGAEVEAPQIILPIGISFFTFQILSYMIDLYRGKYHAQRNLIHLALYISFFPQLIAGPIVQYKDINEQMIDRSCTWEKAAQGIRRFIYGLGKKVILANILAEAADTIFTMSNESVGGALAWMGAILYTLQIYYDFSGYSDMAIGLGKVFGFEFRENFNLPYLSGSIQEFWQRWHISLGTWFREYLYIPLGGNRKGTKRTYFNLIVVFFTTGLWHGAGFSFIAWGLYHGAFQILERLGLRRWLDHHKPIAHVYTMLVVVTGWVLFRADTLLQACVMLKRMLLPWLYLGTGAPVVEAIGTRALFILVIALLGCGPHRLLAEKLRLEKRWKDSWMELIWCTLVFLLSIALLASDTYNPFIYFRF